MDVNFCIAQSLCLYTNTISETHTYTGIHQPVALHGAGGQLPPGSGLGGTEGASVNGGPKTPPGAPSQATNGRQMAPNAHLKCVN